MNQKITFRNPKTNNVKIGSLNLKTDIVTDSKNNQYCLSELNDVKYLETYINGKLIQKVGRFLGLVKKKTLYIR
jgi:hypothetical protein